MQKTIKRMTGYKATDADMRCKGYRFRLGEWSEPVTGELEECENGYHFCENMSGVWSYYPLPDGGTRVFKVEAEEILEKSPEPGACVKRVCRRLRLIEEVTGFDGRGNVGEGNSGCGNSGSYNAGSGNTGYCNTGYRNTGDYNTGDVNTGHRNTGNCNTGSRNTGDWNTGSYNTGDGNTGNLNTGSDNTGDRNTGSGNACSNSSGFFEIKEPVTTCFGASTGLRRSAFLKKYGYLVEKLGTDLTRDEVPDFEKYRDLPNITPAKLTALHRKHKRLRKKGAA